MLQLPFCPLEIMYKVAFLIKIKIKIKATLLYVNNHYETCFNATIFYMCC
ncbi:hypothetical protein Hanom_Chr16g01492661 [Helianthus anomalus]